MPTDDAVRPQQQRPIGRRVIVTRPAEQAGPWVDGLRKRGIDAVAVPLLGIEDAPDPAAVDAAWAALSDYAMLFFVSPNAVARFFARRPPGRDWPDGVLAAVPGPGSSAVLRDQGIGDARIVEPAADAPSFDSESLWQRLQHMPWRNRRVLIVRGEGGRDWLASRLREAGAEVSWLAAYRRGAAALPQAIRQLIGVALAEPQRHLWFFSSSEAIDHLLASGVASRDMLGSALARSSALATHPRIAKRARAAGFAEVVESRPAIDDVAACIQSWPTLDLSSASRSSL
ncbi:uroporphyrinogen-III synthase [Piscinibacter sakaiensis]|uniref:uroporphyrinogen-III synthase n=1 Tax=Piscinibacter sakaiensis TaxID=1547922 RepID=UPI003AAD8BED